MPTEKNRLTKIRQADRIGEPLKGRRILILKAEHQPDRAATLLREEGAEPEVISAVRVEIPRDLTEIDNAWHRAASFDWLAFMSSKAADTFLGRMRAIQVEPAHLPKNIAAVGPATLKTLELCGVSDAWMPAKFTPRGLAAELPEDRGRKVLVVRSEKTTSVVDDTLRSRGFEVERLNAYTTIPLDTARLRKLAESDPDAIVVTSPSSARALTSVVSEGAVLPPVCSISPATSEALSDGGIVATMEAVAHSSEGLAKALSEYFGE